jgi:two-component system chemotaxis sensor kinase CheA
MALVDLPEGIPLLESLYQYQDVHPAARSVSEIVAPPNEPLALSPLRQFSLRFYPDTFRFGFYPLSFLHDLNISGSTILWQWQTRTGTGYPPTYSTRMAA